MKRFSAIFFLYGLASSGMASADELVSFELVRQSSGSMEVRQSYATSTPVIVGDRLELSSDSGYDFGLKVMRSTYSELGNRIINATTDAGGTAILVLDKDGKLLGSITEMGERHQISTSADGKRQIIKEGYSGNKKRIDDGVVMPPVDIPTGNIQLEMNEPEVSSAPYRMMEAEQSSTVIYPTYRTGTAKIAVFMYYDESMSNALSATDFITQVANDAYADSGARVEIEIVGTKALNIDDNASHYDLKSAMSDAETPFENIESDRNFSSADLVFLLRDTESPDGEDPCGIASIGVRAQRHWRGAYTGMVQWLPNDGVGTYCSNYSFAHEVGHLLGAQHNREDLTDDGEVRLGAYSYSHGTSLEGVFQTIMGANSFESTGLFSSPDFTCDGYPCGKPASRSDSADNVSTFHSTGHLVASNEGEFVFEAVSTFAARAEESECTTSDDADGYFRGIYLSNQSALPVEVVSTHFGKPDGTYFVSERESGEFVVQPGSSYGWGFCREVGADPVMGTVYDKAFHRYLHPETGQIVEAITHEWDEDYEGEYRKVRVASSSGGSVSGNPTQSVRLGSSKTFTFVPESGYEVAGIQSNCSGRKSGNRYTVDVGQDDCFVEARFNQVAVAEILRVSVEAPAEGQVYSGIGTFQGWAVAQEGIDRVDLYIDGAFFQSAPYGGVRGDVGNVFPEVPSSSSSGFALAFNYGNLTDGRHTLRAVAVTKNGRTLERSTAFSVTKFHKPFIGPQDTVSLNGASCSVQGSQMSVINAVIDNKPYDISLEWRTGTQGFEIYRIR